MTFMTFEERSKPTSAIGEGADGGVPQVVMEDVANNNTDSDDDEEERIKDLRRSGRYFAEDTSWA